MKKLLFLIIVLALAGLVFVLVRNFSHQHVPVKVTLCKNNLNNIASAIEMYAQNHKGELPDRLEQLKPSILKEIPVCWYDRSGEEKPAGSTYDYARKKKSWVIFCQGHRHADYPLPENFPQYSSDQGLLLGN